MDGQDAHTHKAQSTEHGEQQYSNATKAYAKSNMPDAHTEPPKPTTLPTSKAVELNTTWTTDAQHAHTATKSRHNSNQSKRDARSDEHNPNDPKLSTPSSGLSTRGGLHPPPRGLARIAVEVLFILFCESLGFLAIGALSA